MADDTQLLDVETRARILTDIVRAHGPITRDELERLYLIAVDEFESMLVASALWDGWTKGEFEFLVIDDEVKWSPIWQPPAMT